MNRTTPRKRSAKQSADESAASFIALVCRCEWCQRTNVALVCHEIARGGGVRYTARQADYARLVLCDECHAAIHRMAGQDAVACGLALLHHAGRLELEKFYTLTARRWPALEVIELWTKRIINHR